MGLGEILKASQGAALLVAADVTSSGFESMGDRMMAVTLGEGKKTLRVFAFHAPHSGKDDKVLSEWWWARKTLQRGNASQGCRRSVWAM